MGVWRWFHVLLHSLKLRLKLRTKSLELLLMELSMDTTIFLEMKENLDLKKCHLPGKFHPPGIFQNPWMTLMNIALNHPGNGNLPGKFHLPGVHLVPLVPLENHP